MEEVWRQPPFLPHAAPTKWTEGTDESLPSPSQPPPTRLKTPKSQKRDEMTTRMVRFLVSLAHPPTAEPPAPESEGGRVRFDTFTLGV